MDLRRSNTHSPTRSPSPTASAFAHQRRDACLEMATILKLGCPEVLASLRLNADRIAAMLTGLVRRERRRVEASA